MALTFDGKYAEDKNFAVVQEFTGLTKQPPVLYQTAASKSIGYVVALDNLPQAAAAMQFLIENTYPVFKEKNF